MPTPKTWTDRAADILLDERNKRYLGMTEPTNPGASKDAPVTAAGRALLLPTRLLRTDWPPNDGVAEGNARFDDMLESVGRLGIQEPLTINLRWSVLDGHHRLAAARHLGIESVPVRVWTGVEFVP